MSAIVDLELSFEQGADSGMKGLGDAVETTFCFFKSKVAGSGSALVRIIVLE